MYKHINKWTHTLCVLYIYNIHIYVYYMYKFFIHICSKFILGLSALFHLLLVLVPVKDGFQF